MGSHIIKINCVSDLAARQFVERVSRKTPPFLESLDVALRKRRGSPSRKQLRHVKRMNLALVFWDDIESNEKSTRQQER